MSTEEIVSRNNLYGFEMREPDGRRVPERKTYEIKSLWQRNHEIVNLAARGFKNTQIAEILGITPATVSNTLNSTLGEHKLSDIRMARDEEAKKTVEKIRVLTSKALNIYHDIFDDDSGQCNLKDKGEFARSFLNDMSGLKAPTRIQSTHASYTLTREEIEEFKRRGIEAGREAGLIVDVVPEEVKEIESNDSLD